MTIVTLAARPRRATPFYFDPITNLSSWTRPATVSTDKTFRLLTLHSLVTPAPLRRRNAPDSILTSIHPSLRAWLAPLLHPRQHLLSTDQEQDQGDIGVSSRQPQNWNGNSRRRQVAPIFNLPLNRNNLGQHLDQLLLSYYDSATTDETDTQESRQQEAVDVLEDSSRVAHQVADLLTNYEEQSAGQRKLFSHKTKEIPGTILTPLLQNLCTTHTHPKTNKRFDAYSRLNLDDGNRLFH